MMHLYQTVRSAAWWALALLGPTAAFGQNPTWHMAAVPTQPTGSSSVATASTVDAAGNVYLTGTFEGTVSFGSTALTSAGQTDVFVAKWDAATRSFAWAQRAGSPGTDDATAIAVLGSSVYVAGAYSGSQASFGNVVLPNQGTPQGMYIPRDGFVAKLADTGSSADFAWALRASGPQMESVSALAVSGTNVYLAGSFTSPTLELGSVTLTNSGPTGTSTHTSDLFVAQLNDAGSSGSIAWAERTGGPDYEGCTGLAAQGNDLYLYGTFGGRGSGTTIGTTTLTAAPNAPQLYVAKLTATSTARQWAWAVQAGSADLYANSPTGLAVYGTGVYVTGYYSSSGPVVFGGLSLPGRGALSMYLAKLTDAGSTASWTWVRGNEAAGGTSYGHGVRASAAGVFLLGSYFGGAIRLGSISLPNTGTTIVPIVARLTDAGAYTWIQSVGTINTTLSARALAVQGQQLYVAGSLNDRTATFGNYTVTVPNSSTSNPTGSRQAALLAGLTDNTILRSADPAWAAALHLAPNPAREQVALTVPPIAGARHLTLTLTDALGRTVRATTHALPAEGLRQQLELRGLAPGLYVLRVQAGAQHAARPLLVE